MTKEIPEVFSSVLEFLYRGDYHPRLVHDKKRNSWILDEEDDGPRKGSCAVTTVLDIHSDQVILKDTAIYCSAHRFGLEDLKRSRCGSRVCKAGYSVRSYSQAPDTPMTILQKVMQSSELTILRSSSEADKHSNGVGKCVDRSGIIAQSNYTDWKKYIAGSNGNWGQDVLRSLRSHVQSHGRHFIDNKVASLSVFLISVR